MFHKKKSVWTINTIRKDCGNTNNMNSLNNLNDYTTVQAAD